MRNLVILIVAAIVIIGGLTLINRGKDQQRNPNSVSSQVPVQSKASTASQTVAVNYVNGQLSLKNLTVNAGDTVLFVNADDKPHWPASDPHPSHSKCPGFDSLNALQKGQSYAMTFHVVGVCSYHDHLNPSNAALKGVITVQ